MLPPPRQMPSGVPGAAPSQDSRFLVDNIQEVHDNRQIVDGHRRVHRVLRENRKKSHLSQRSNRLS